MLSHMNMTMLKTVSVVCAGNCMSEFMGLITGTYEAKVFSPCFETFLSLRINIVHLIKTLCIEGTKNTRPQTLLICRCHVTFLGLLMVACVFLSLKWHTRRIM